MKEKGHNNVIMYQRDRLAQSTVKDISEYIGNVNI